MNSISHTIRTHFKVTSKVIGLLAMVSFTTCALGQTYLGLSFDVGNRVVATPSTSQIHRSLTPAGSIVCHRVEHLKNNWALQYGGSFGIMGLLFKSNEFGALSRNAVYDVFFTSTFLSVGRAVTVGRIPFLIFAGGGASQYLHFGDTSAEVSPDSEGLAYGNFKVPNSNKPHGFLEAALQFPIYRRITMNIQYQYHLSRSFQGYYAYFYGTQSTSQGHLKMYQRGIGVQFLIKLDKREKKS